MPPTSRLAVYGWNLSAGRQPQEELAILTRNRDLLRADITRAQEIRKKIPAIKDDCDKFEESLYPASKGYSSVSAELDSIAGKSGLAARKHADSSEADVKGPRLAAGGNRSGGDRQLFAGRAFPERTCSDRQTFTPLKHWKRRRMLRRARMAEVRVSMHIKTYFRTT